MKNKFFLALVIVAVTMCLVGCVSFGPGGSSALSQFIGAQTSGQSSASGSSGSGSGTGSGASSTSAASNSGNETSASSSAAKAAFTGDVAAGNAASSNLTSSDVEAFIANYNEIFTVMNSETENMSYNDVESILDQYGISGPGRSQKVAMIARCESVLMFEAELQADPESARVLKSMGMDPIAEIRAETNAADMEVVKPYYGQLYVLMNED